MKRVCQAPKRVEQPARADDATDEKAVDDALDDVKTPPSVGTLTTEESAARNATIIVAKTEKHERRRDERRGAEAPPTCAGSATASHWDDGVGGAVLSTPSK